MTIEEELKKLEELGSAFLDAQKDVVIESLRFCLKETEERNEKLEKENEKMLESLKDMTRLVDAFRYTTTLGKGQSERLEKAKQCLKEVGDA